MRNGCRPQWASQGQLRRSIPCFRGITSPPTWSLKPLQAMINNSKRHQRPFWNMVVTSNRFIRRLFWKKHRQANHPADSSSRYPIYKMGPIRAFRSSLSSPPLSLFHSTGAQGSCGIPNYPHLSPCPDSPGSRELWAIRRNGDNPGARR